MKINKKISTIIILSLVLFVLHASNVYALKRAIFPDSKSLQPMPKDSYPNVSGNINSSVGEPLVTPEDTIPQSPVTELVANNPGEVKDSTKYIFWIISATILFGGLLYEIGRAHV